MLRLKKKMYSPRSSFRILSKPVLKCSFCKELVEITNVEIANNITYQIGSGLLPNIPSSKEIRFQARCNYCTMNFDGLAKAIAHVDTGQVILHEPMIERGSMRIGREIEHIDYMNPSHRYG